MFQTIRSYVTLFQADITPTQSQCVPSLKKINTYIRDTDAIRSESI